MKELVGHAPRDPGEPGGRYLLLNRCMIESADHAELALGPCVKHSGNPLPLNGASVWCRNNLYCNIHWDPDRHEYKGWTREAQRIRSRDGFEWETEEGTPAGETLMHDPHDPNPQRRYKTIFHVSGYYPPESTGPTGVSPEDAARLRALGLPEKPGMVVGCSPDGIHWPEHHPALEQTARRMRPGDEDWAGGDCHNTVIWAPEIEKYVAFIRTNLRQLFGSRRERAVGRIESRDFVHWGPHEIALESRVSWLGRLGHPKYDFYQMIPFRYAGLYLGIVSVFFWEADTVHLELAWSPDSFHWERVSPGQDFIPQGDPGTHDSGCLYATYQPVATGDEVRVYYGGSAGRHNRDKDRVSGLCLATFPLDRFVGMQPRCGARAAVVTRPLDVGGRALSLNANASLGSIRVEVRDVHGRPVDGFRMAECAALTGDHLRAPVSWKGGATLPDARGRGLGLAFDLEHARLYSFSASRPA